MPISDGRIGRVTWGLDYTFLVATYQSPEVVDGSANNTSDSALSGYPGLDGNIYIHPGNRIPLIPKQTGKAFADYPGHVETRVRSQRSGGVEFLRAREREQRVPGRLASTISGPAFQPGYAITNFRAHYDLTKHLQLAVPDR